MKWKDILLSANGLSTQIFQEVDPLGESGGVRRIHTSGYVQVYSILLHYYFFSWCAKKVTDGGNFFRACEDLGVFVS